MSQTLFAPRSVAGRVSKLPLLSGLKLARGSLCGLLAFSTIVGSQAVAQTEATVDTATPTTIVVAFGGNATCQTDSERGPEPSPLGLAQLMAATVEELSETLGPDNVRYALSCYSPTADYTSYTTDLGEEGTFLKVPYQRMIEDLAQRINALPHPRLVVMGFSYGAWTSLKFLPLLGAHVQVDSLVTLDPISKENCTVETLLKAAADEKTHPGCVEAPRDFSASELELATTKPGLWLNIYQDHGIFLHSGPIPGAQNILRNFPEAKARTVWPHLLVARDQELRRELAHRLALRVTQP